MNKANKSIGWAGYTWNPIKGLCPVGCWYCYARKIYKRFKMNPEVRFEFFKSLENKPKIPEGSKIFICSTIELFHPQVKKEWRDKIFETIELNPQHTFQILTKMPENIDRPMPENAWLGVTVTGDCSDLDFHIANYFGWCGRKAKVQCISYEPILGRGANIGSPNIDWYIVGRLTGYGKKHDPMKWWIKRIVENAKKRNIPIFMKGNLKEIWGGKLIQEFPEE